MIPKRIPIRSPIQQQDLSRREFISPPQNLSLSAFGDVSKLVDQMKQLVETFEAHAETATEFINHISEIQKGNQGDKGERGDKGESVFTEADMIPYLEYMIEQVTKKIPVPIPGKQGIPGPAPILGKDYFTESHKQEILAGILKNIHQPKDGETPIIDHEKIIENVISRIQEGKVLKKEHINGFESEMATYRGQLAGKIYGKDTWARGGGDTVTAGSNVTITKDANGNKIISSTGGSGGTWTRGEKITLQGDNRTFTLTNAPSSVINLTVDRQLQLPVVDYTGTINGTNKTFVFVTAITDSSLQALIYADYS